MDVSWRTQRTAELKKLWLRDPNALLEMYYSASAFIETDKPSLNKLIETIVDSEEQATRPLG